MTFEDWFEKFNYSTYGEYCKSDLKSAYKAGQKDKTEEEYQYWLAEIKEEIKEHIIRDTEKRVAKEIRGKIENLFSTNCSLHVGFRRKMFNLLNSLCEKYGVSDE